MKRPTLSTKATSSIEILALILIVIAAAVYFGGYIQRAMTGRWKATGDAYGQGHQYDPRGFGNVGENGGTMDCFFDDPTGLWIDEELYRQNNCDCTGIRGDGVPLPEYTTHCLGCKTRSPCARPPLHG